MILYDEHTFGVAITHNNQQTWSYGEDFIINKSLDYYSYAEASWQEKANRIQTAERIVIPIMNQQLKQLAASVSVEGKRIIVFNSLPWTRSGRVNFFAGIYQKNFTIYGVKEAESGEIIPVYNDRNLVSFEAQDIPPTGYKTYIPVLEPIKVSTRNTLLTDERNRQIENQYFRLIINPETGALKSVSDKINNKEMVDAANEDGFAQYVYEQFGQEDLTGYNKAYVKPGSESWANQEMGRPSVPETKRKVFKGRCEKIVYRNMGNAVSASVFGKCDDPGNQRYIVTYTLYEDQPYVEINWGINGKSPDANPEAGWLAFPFSLVKPEYRLYRTGGIVDPKKDFIARSNQDYFFLNTSMTMFDETGTGYALNSPSSPGISIGERGLYKFSGKKDPVGSRVYVNLYNTQWGTNFAEWIEGSFSSKLYIWSYSGYDPEKSLITPSEETRVPLYAIHLDGTKGTCPLTNQGLALSRKGVLVTAYGKNRDGEGTILRLWEQSGSEVECNISLPPGSKFKMAAECDLRGELTESHEIKITDGQFTASMKANKPATFILK
jgi:hypothetical protein